MCHEFVRWEIGAEPSCTLWACPGRSVQGSLAACRQHTSAYGRCGGIFFGLLEGNASAQNALAGRAGVSQVRISQVLHALERWVQRTDRGWAATDTADLTQWLVEQPPPGRTAMTWLGLDEPAPAATIVAHWLAARSVSYALSSDVAADRLAPWARPIRALVYVDQALDLRRWV
jgi:hypothetical protein